MRSDGPGELLYDSDRTHVTRIRAADGTWVVRKQPLGPGAAERLRTERDILGRLAGVPGTPRLADVEAEDGELLLVAIPGRTLAEIPSPWAAGPLIKLAHRLALVLAGVHRHGVIHRDVSPANILIPADEGHEPVLLDYELATTAVQDGAAAERIELAGTLPYLAPEQTGRTGRPVDHRADLYALGATLYELATGAPPFGRDRDPLSLTHDHLARVPDPPSEAHPQVPAALSEIILRLLSKEPGRRYQSGEGLAHDLAVLRDRYARGVPGVFPLGERDFPLRLPPPARLIGRAEPLAALNGLLSEAVSGHSVLAVVTGPPGVGKTALVDRLRPAVARAGGRFVAGKFAQFGHDIGGDAIREAFDLLGNQLLAEPDEVVAVLRERLQEAVGADSGLVGMMMPPFRALLGVEPSEPAGEDPRSVFARLRRAALTLLRTLASSDSPVVFFLDDLQWASPGAFRFLDDVLDADLPGLLVLGAYREEEVDETHPLSAILARIRRERGDSREVRLANLGHAELAALIAAMLRMPESDAAPLASLLAMRTGGNPFDTMELLNALRRQGALVPAGAGWSWDDDTVRRFVGHGDVVDLLGARIEALPAPTRDLVEVMSCLGGEVDLNLLRVAGGLPRERVTALLLPAVADGLLVRDATVVRFRHDRVQQAAYGRLDDQARAERGLALARRLAADPRHAAAAAPQYLAAAELLRVPGKALPGERVAAADLLRRASAAARLVANQAGAELHLAAALRLLTTTDAGYAETTAEWHAALCALGRFDDADRVFGEIMATGGAPVWLAGPVAEQVGALSSRLRMAEALDLGRDMLARLGVDVPDRAAMGPRIGAGMAAFHRWLDTAGDGADLPEVTDPALLAPAHLINRMLAAAFYSDKQTLAWLVVEAAALWTGHGVCAPLTGTLGNLGVAIIAAGGDRRDAYRSMRHVLAVGDAHGYEPQTSQVRFLHSLGVVHWFEPLENSIRLAHEARDGLLRGGDLRNALYTYFAALPQLLDRAPDLATVDRERRDAEAFAERVGASGATSMFQSIGRLIRALHGETSPPGTLGEGEDGFLAGFATDTPGQTFHAIIRALSAAIFGDDDTLIRDSDQGVRGLPSIPGSYPNTQAHVVGVLGAAARARRSTGAEREAALAEVDRCRDFLAARAADQPANFRHLQHFAEATRAAAHGDYAAAALAYDAAIVDAGGRSWHGPLITERAALFHLAYGLEHVGTRLIAEACQGYAAWGATGKVQQLKREHPVLATALSGAWTPRAATQGRAHSLTLSSEVIDLMAVLDAARALSSETSLERLRIRVQHVLSQLTGATAVHMIVRDDRGDGWILPGEGTAPTAEQLPLTVVRYAERTGEPMLVEDVTLDDRVSRDPYLAGLDHCSLLAVPVLGHGQPRAMLLLENRLNRRAFSTGRLNAVELIAGQLTVSLENAQVYASLERKVAERTEELGEANRQLELLTVTDPLTGLPNRRKLTAFLADEWLRSQRSGAPIGVAMIDIDHFKKYNDHYGHQGGDECLRTVAEALRGSVRGTDLVARYGGEEFCIVMPGAGPVNALLVAERACRTVAALREPHALADEGFVTVSVGVTAGTPTVHTGPEQLTKLADEALYEAKRAGRNRVVSG
ncbi:diguanylate cyclase [Actinoplanes sp. NBRC 101535]|uniref:diguanylate cyclase n=1 Tax=Actinoplanes sp. NBRC 101535 TaxID=3032196 RepID=UPI0024A30B78|nr:diguanylate cyclase [Actinoplanes sp. NBRC 101535]GLY02868.1 hypothetical protein Acsp01_32470 [Actinoplanes sp. NBRC 101535]